MRICYVVNSPRRLAARPSVWRLPAAELRCMLSWQGASGGPAGGQQGISVLHTQPFCAAGCARC